MDVPEEKAFYSIAEFAALLGISERTVRRLIKDGELQVVRLGSKVIRIPASAIQPATEPQRAPVNTGSLKAIVEAMG